MYKKMKNVNMTIRENIVAFAKSEEIWRPVVGFEGKYEVSSLGRVLSVRNKRVLPVYLNRKGYQKVEFHYGKPKKMKFIHRLVALSFISNPDNKPMVNHKNGIKTDNRVENLEWMTNRENVVHSFEVLGRKSTHTNKKVMCVETGEVFESISMAATRCKIHESCIVKTAKGKQKTAAGYKWEYV